MSGTTTFINIQEDEGDLLVKKWTTYLIIFLGLLLFINSLYIIFIGFPDILFNNNLKDKYFGLLSIIFLIGEYFCIKFLFKLFDFVNKKN